MNGGKHEFPIKKDSTVKYFEINQGRWSIKGRKQVNVNE